MAKSKFPKVLFVKIESEGTDNEYLLTGTEVEQLAEIGNTVLVAEYKLVQSQKIKAVVNYVKSSEAAD